MVYLMVLGVVLIALYCSTAKPKNTLSLAEKENMRSRLMWKKGNANMNNLCTAACDGTVVTVSGSWNMCSMGNVKCGKIRKWDTREDN